MFAQLNPLALLSFGFGLLTVLICLLMNSSARLRREQPFTEVHKGRQEQEEEDSERQAV